MVVTDGDVSFLFHRLKVKEDFAQKGRTESNNLFKERGEKKKEG